MWRSQNNENSGRKHWEKESSTVGCLLLYMHTPLYCRVFVAILAYCIVGCFLLYMSTNILGCFFYFTWVLHCRMLVTIREYSILGCLLLYTSTPFWDACYFTWVLHCRMLVTLHCLLPFTGLTIFPEVRQSCPHSLSAVLSYFSHNGNLKLVLPWSYVNRSPAR